MRVLQIISVLLLLLTSTLKLSIIDIPLDDNIIHYFFNASIILTGFSVMFPIVSYFRIKKLKIERDGHLTLILNEMVSEQNTEVFISRQLNNVVTLFKNKQQIIICGKPILELLDNSQVKFLLAHEYFHIKKNHLIKNILSFTFAISGVPILLLIISPFLISRISILWVLIIAFIVYISCFIFHFIFSQRREFAADKYASFIVDSEVAKNTLSILKKHALVPEKSYNIFETHPSLNKRIEKVASK
ncbi:hypothetical conserved protein [Oceanobacillus iheyensis HTE831]|uniref:Hypothetical conserved protein n=1 Tax=Oceanobacillus iheyensis (strain DSM 14371 / CIP 107618 / JCM 11309 / KCTC 3954 / HTE831) TaxID=221109 RepID=Q8ETU9_OCEIH|nr:M48 family metalloprotease [Oceanobacillus iheyensis]BAC12112.1 hypothetical conserved protein [Oceanobacillus iheyensis HTE831]